MQGTAVQILNWVNRRMWGIVWNGFIGTILNRFLIIFMMYSFRFMTKNEKKTFSLFRVPCSVPQKEKKTKRNFL